MYYSRSVSSLEPGLNIYGYVFAEHGVGEEARSLVRVARHANLAYSVIPYIETFSRQAVPFSDFGRRESIFDTNLFVVNADTVPKFVRHIGPEMLAGRYNIGMWAWEVEDLPPEMTKAASYLDEIWSCSQFSADAIARSVPCPVYTLPLPVTVPLPIPTNRRDLGLSEKFLFLFCFDFNSIFERKNALAIIDSYQQAFATDDGTELLIKTINGDDFQSQHQRLQAAALGRPDIKVVDGYLQGQDQVLLMNSCDAYVSLHRSEGFGFTMAEAMALGKPVIATGYSGNMDFMTPDNSYLVPFERVRVGKGSAPYPADSFWANPNVEEAATLMRRVFDYRDEARGKAQRARQDIEGKQNPEIKARIVIERLESIRRQQTSSDTTTAQSYSVLGYGEKPGETKTTIRNEILESQKLHTERTHRAFSSLRGLLNTQPPMLTESDILSGLVCGAFDGVKTDDDGSVGLWGWAYDPRTKSPVRAVILFINGQQLPIRIPVERQRSDVADYLGEPDLTNAGWTFVASPSFLIHGKNDFEVYALLDDGRFGRVPGHGGNTLTATIN